MTKIIIEIEVDVTYKHIKGSPGLRTYPNGDPGYPPESSSLEVQKVEYNGHNITNILTIDDVNFIESSLNNDWDDYDWDDSDRGDDRHDDRFDEDI